MTSPSSRTRFRSVGRRRARPLSIFSKSTSPRGRTVNLAGAGWNPQYLHVPFVNQHDYDSVVLFFVGNDHRQYGLWYYNIPTLEEVSHTSSPFFYLVLSRLLNPPGALFPRPH